MERGVKKEEGNGRKTRRSARRKQKDGDADGDGDGDDEDEQKKTIVTMKTKTREEESLAILGFAEKRSEKRRQTHTVCFLLMRKKTRP
jgi:hypothetical protein